MQEVVTKSAQYPETLIKYLSQIELGDVITEELITKLVIVQEAQIKGLKDELVNLVVASELEPKKLLCADTSSIRKPT